MAALFGYAVDIRSLSKGRAEQSTMPSHYAQLPSSITLDALTS